MCSSDLGSLAFLDKEINGVKQGFLNLLGHLNPTGGGASYQTKIKSADFINAMATGVGVVEGKPISQIDPTIQVKLNAPSVQTLAKLLFSTAPSQVTQAAISSDTQKVFDGSGGTALTLGVWYLIGARNLSKFIASIDNGAGTFTDLVSGSDYDLDTELGAIRFNSGGTHTLTGTEKISCLYQAGALTNAPQIAPGASPNYTYGGLYIYMVLAANEARSNPEVWLRYLPRARIEPSGNFDVGVDKPAEITLDIMGVPSSEISGQPYGYLKQIAGTMRAIA